MNTSTKKAAALLAAVMTMAAVSGCGSRDEGVSANTPAKSTAQTSPAIVDSSAESAETATTTTAATTTTTTTEAPEELPDDSSSAEQPEAEPIANPNRAVVADCVLEQDDFMKFDDPTENYMTRWYNKGYMSAWGIVAKDDEESETSKTYRDIKIGSTAEEILEAYGETELVTLEAEDDIFYLSCILSDVSESTLDTIKNSAGFYEYSGYLPEQRLRPMRYTAGLRFYVDEEGKVTALCCYLNYYSLLSYAYDDAGWSKISNIAHGGDIYSVRDTYLAPMYRLGRAAYSYALDYAKPIPIYHFGADGIITVEYDSSIAAEAAADNPLDGASYTEEAPGIVNITFADESARFSLQWNDVFGTYLLFNNNSNTNDDYCFLLVPVVP